MADDAKLYRERANKERDIAATTLLAMIRAQSLRAAERWDELAARAERAAAGALQRNGTMVANRLARSDRDHE